MNAFQFNPVELIAFFAVLVRYGTLAAVLPFIGDRMVPGPVKVLFALAISIALFPALVQRGEVKLSDAALWGSSVGGIAGTVALEAITGLVLGYVSKLCFDSISIGANLAGNFMGFSIASQYDPHMESQTQVIAELQVAIAMLIFLGLDGHHLMIRAAFQSYEIVGVGKAGFGALFSERLIVLVGEVFKFGIQIAAPVAVSIFAVNVGFGVMGKAMPQLNILVLSLAVTALVGLLVLFISVPEFSAIVASIFERMGDWMRGILEALAHG